MKTVENVVALPGVETRRYLPTLAELIDRLTIVQLKMIFISEKRDEFEKEREDILHDVDLLLKRGPPLTARAVLAISMIMLTNRYIWENEGLARQGGSQQDKLLRLTHSVNGIRNSAKNVLTEEVGGRFDHKVDCFASELIEEFGNWDVLR